MAKPRNEYFEKLKSPRWQQKRLVVLEESGWECENCGDKEKPLHVHHKRYVFGRDPWDYENWELQCLCEDCHHVATVTTAELKQCMEDVLLSGNIVAIGQCIGYMKAIAGCEAPTPAVHIGAYEQAEGAGHFLGIDPEGILDRRDSEGRIKPFEISQENKPKR